MKKLIITILISLSVGSGFAFFIYKNIQDEVEVVMKEENIVYFFQVVVFKDEMNALNYMQNYNSSIIIKDEEYFRVIIGIAVSKEAVDKLKSYFDELNINYYLKKESIDNQDLTDKIKEYEVALLKAQKNTYNKINQDILKAYEKNSK